MKNVAIVKKLCKQLNVDLPNMFDQFIAIITLVLKLILKLVSKLLLKLQLNLE